MCVGGGGGGGNMEVTRMQILLSQKIAGWTSAGFPRNCFQA